MSTKAANEHFRHQITDPGMTRPTRTPEETERILRKIHALVGGQTVKIVNARCKLNGIGPDKYRAWKKARGLK